MPLSQSYAVGYRGVSSLMTEAGLWIFIYNFAGRPLIQKITGENQTGEKVPAVAGESQSNLNQSWLYLFFTGLLNYNYW